MNRIIEIQQELKAPKGQYNSFGKYKYRNCEDILEAVKPLLAARNLFITLNDEIEYIGTRFYVKATATIYDNGGKKLASTSAYAREEESKKGMDGSQVTGASSSYARKYALNGLFAIDDTKDSDTTNQTKTDKVVSIQPKPLNEKDIDIIEGLKGMDCKENAHRYFKTYEKEVEDIANFKKVYAAIYTKLPTLEELQTPQEVG